MKSQVLRFQAKRLIGSRAQTSRAASRRQLLPVVPDGGRPDLQDSPVLQDLQPWARGERQPVLEPRDGGHGVAQGRTLQADSAAGIDGHLLHQLLCVTQDHRWGWGGGEGGEEQAASRGKVPGCGGRCGGGAELGARPWLGLLVPCSPAPPKPCFS